ncbi:hypothetical protein RND61_23675 [Streptomyces sp. TRM76323]|uniref:Uncharacterized protein n=1 Tax=Streptomyces tamarix TaxID=3078565 RepID=A0ABU3QQH9_9ACTN|nr:hypothetical protein [Streptomyces tamarix]MDT9685035.1 hypothetical protein [Streptomyces tamarix]
MTGTPRHPARSQEPLVGTPAGRPRVPPLDAALRPRLAAFLLRRYLRDVVVQAAGPDRHRPAVSPLQSPADAQAAPIHRHTR